MLARQPAHAVCTSSAAAAGDLTGAGLSAYDVPVGLLATVLKRRERGEASAAYSPLQARDLPTALPPREIPEPRVAASVQRFYAGERPDTSCDAEMRSRSPSPGGSRFGSEQQVGDERHATGSAVSDHGRRHVGLGGAGLNAFDDFRTRKGNTYREHISVGSRGSQRQR